MAKMKLKKGDRVVVISGRDKGRTGEIVKALPSENRVIVQGINLVKRHTRQSQTSSGGIIEKEASIHVSNVAYVDPKDDKPTRLGFKIIDGGRKVRVARRSGEVIDQ
jgi:large subunit ribosomal protein L24